MRRYHLNALPVFLLLSLSACQSHQSTPNLFSPLSSFSPSFTQTSNLAQSVQDALMRSDDPFIAQVHVQTRQDVVLLSGYVKKIRQSDVAEQIARQVPGVKSVENHIIIRQ